MNSAGPATILMNVVNGACAGNRTKVMPWKEKTQVLISDPFAWDTEE